jgi:hypothetical protein
MEQLRQLDEVAYVRFASVYRRFQDVSEFKVEIDKLGQKLEPALESKAELKTDTKLAEHSAAVPTPTAD